MLQLWVLGVVSLLGTEMGMKAFFGGLNVGMGIQIVTTVCKKATT